MNQPRDRIGLAILLVVSAVALFAILNVEVKMLRADFGPVQLVWARYAGALFFMLAVFTPMRGRRFLLLRTARPVAQIVRGACLLSSSLCFFLAIKWVPLATAAAITMLGPVLITAFSGPVLGERVGPRRWSAVVVGFIGALVIIRPGFGDTPWQIVFTVGSAFTSAFYSLLTRKLSAGDDPATSATIATVVGTAALSLVVWGDWRTPSSATEIGMIVSLGLLSGLGHYLYNHRLRLRPGLRHCALQLQPPHLRSTAGLRRLRLLSGPLGLGRSGADCGVGPLYRLSRSGAEQARALACRPGEIRP